MTRLRRGVMVALVVIAVVCSACGGDESDPSRTVAATDTATTTTAGDDTDSGETTDTATTTTAGDDTDSGETTDTATTTTAGDDTDSGETTDTATTTTAGDDTDSGETTDTATTTTAGDDTDSGETTDTATTTTAGDDTDSGETTDTATTTTAGDDTDSGETTDTATTTTAGDDTDSGETTDTATTTTAGDDTDSGETTDTATTTTAGDDTDSGETTDTATTTTAGDDTDSGETTDTATTTTAGDDTDSGETTDTATTTTAGDDTDSGETTDTATTAPDDAGSAEPAGVTVPPAELGFDPFYEKYLDLEGLPIVSSARVPDEALLQARRLISEMLANRRDVLSTLAASNVRVAIMAESSGITELPELSDLYEVFPGVDWDNRTRGGGVGPTFERPVLAIAEENLLCYSTDLFPHEDIVVHEAAHAVLNMGIELQSGGVAFRQELERAYRDALGAGLWQGTYAAENPDEYWAEGVQSWFDVNDPPGPIHNEINTRPELEEYDPALAALVRDALGDVTLSSSCHSAAIHPHSNSRILGTLLGPDRTGVGGVVLWAWSGEASTSGFSTTQPNGTFTIAVPNGSFTLDIHANTGEDCTFVGWYGPDGFTTMRESATLVVVDGASVSGVEIILPQELDQLPFIEWCS